MEDIKFNENDLYFCCEEVSNLHSAIHSFKGQISSINGLPGELSSSFLVDCKDIMSDAVDEIDDVNDRITNIKDVAINNFPSIEALFNYYKDGLISSDNEIMLGDQTITIESFDLMTADNGNEYYCLKTSSGDLFYMSVDCSDAPNDVFCYLPGLGGAGSTYAHVKSNHQHVQFCESRGLEVKIEAGIKEIGVPDNTIVAISCSEHNETFLDTVDGIINGANLDISGLHVTSHSESGGMSFLALNDYLKKHPEIENTSLVVLDGYHVASNVINTDNLCDELINRQVPVYIVEPSAPYDRPDPNDLNNVGMTNALQGLGFNTTYVKLSSETDTHHDNIFIGKVVNDGLCRYLAGVSDELLNSFDYRFTKDLSMYQNDFNNLFPIDDINRIIPFYNDNDGIMY